LVATVAALLRQGGSATTMGFCRDDECRSNLILRTDQRACCTPQERNCSRKVRQDYLERHEPTVNPAGGDELTLATDPASTKTGGEDIAATDIARRDSE
jgi:hypothetical protein